MSEFRAWGVLWRSKNKLDGKSEGLMGHLPDPCGPSWCGPHHPLLFPSRQQARDYIARQFGYIATRKDLRVEPHGWRVPKAVRVKVSITIEREGA